MVSADNCCTKHCRGAALRGRTQLFFGPVLAADRCIGGAVSLNLRIFSSCDSVLIYRARAPGEVVAEDFLAGQAGIESANTLAERESLEARSKFSFEALR